VELNEAPAFTQILADYLGELKAAIENELAQRATRQKPRRK
jgi:hypothetical protein